MSIKIHIYLFLMLAYMFAIGKLDIFICFYLFVIMHEISHILVALILGVDIIDITFLPIGVNARYSEKSSPLKELIISLAGPLASFLFSLLLKKQEFVIMNLCICIFNLVPIYPLDGGRILRNLFVIICGYKKGKKISDTISKVFIIILFFISIISVAYFKNYYILILSVYILFISIDELKKEKYYGLIEEVEYFLK